jgi:HrpA-like RNA helicase
MQVVPVSQSQANQRTGRAGRECEGKCYRLFTEESFESLDQSSTPEILRIGVAQVLLQLFAMNISNPLQFPYPTPPTRQAFVNALSLLFCLGALSKVTISLRICHVETHTHTPCRI